MLTTITKTLPISDRSAFRTTSYRLARLGFPVLQQWLRCRQIARHDARFCLSPIPTPYTSIPILTPTRPTTINTTSSTHPATTPTSQTTINTITPTSFAITFTPTTAAPRFTSMATIQNNAFTSAPAPDKTGNKCKFYCDEYLQNPFLYPPWPMPTHIHLRRDSKEIWVPIEKVTIRLGPIVTSCQFRSPLYPFQTSQESLVTTSFGWNLDSNLPSIIFAYQSKSGPRLSFITQMLPQGYKMLDWQQELAYYIRQGQPTWIDLMIDISNDEHIFADIESYSLIGFHVNYDVIDGQRKRLVAALTPDPWIRQPRDFKWQSKRLHARILGTASHSFLASLSNWQRPSANSYYTQLGDKEKEEELVKRIFKGQIVKCKHSTGKYSIGYA